MWVCLARLGVLQENIDGINQNGFGLGVECFDVFEALDSLPGVGSMLDLSEHVIHRHIEYLDDLKSNLDGGLFSLRSYLPMISQEASKFV